VRDKVQVVMMGLKKICSMPDVMNAIDGTYIYIPKSEVGFLKDYYYHKIGVTTLWLNL